MAKNTKLRHFIRSASDAPTRTMSVRVSNDLFERVSKARKHAKARGVAIDINQACAERISELLDEYDRWCDEHADEADDAQTVAAVAAVVADVSSDAAATSDANTSGAFER